MKCHLFIKKAEVKRYVFNFVLKALTSLDFLIWTGKLFQSLGAATVKNLSPLVLNFDFGKTSFVHSVNLNAYLPFLIICIFFKCAGAMSSSALKVSNKTWQPV